MTIQHKDIPDSQLHEVKGASTAGAGQILVASGAGSSGWRALVASDISNAGNIITHNVSEFATAAQGAKADAALLAANNLSDLSNAATARNNLGLGSAATTASTAYATAAQGALASSALQPSGNLAGLASVATARTNLGLGSLATLSAVQGYSFVLYGASLASSQAPTATNTALQVEFGPAQSTAAVSLASNGLITFNQTGYYIVDLFLRFSRTTAVGQVILFSRLLVNGSPVLSPNSISLPSISAVIPFSASIPMPRTAGDTLQLQIIRDSSGTNDGGLSSLTSAASGWGTSPTASVSIYKFTGAV